MTYKLAIGQRAYSSWSLRGWLLFAKFGLPVEISTAILYDPNFLDSLADFSPAKTVPVIKTPEGTVVMETLAIAETLDERHPEAGFWPEDAAARALARGITGEMHASFTALRGACPMNLHHVWKDFDVSDGVQADLARIEQLWGAARELATDGPWLFGRYSIADAFFAPVACRMVGYGLPIGELAEAYCKTTIEDDEFKAWRAAGLKEAPLDVYDQPYSTTPWPGD